MEIQSKARNSGLKAIGLCSIPSARGFWRKMGFSETADEGVLGTQLAEAQCCKGVYGRE